MGRVLSSDLVLSSAASTEATTVTVVGQQYSMDNHELAMTAEFGLSDPN